MSTTIRIPEDLKERLKDLKNIEESYSDVLWRLIDTYKNGEGTKEPYVRQETETLLVINKSGYPKYKDEIEERIKHADEVEGKIVFAT